MIRLLLALAALVLCGPVTAQPAAAQPVADLPHTRAELILESREPAAGKAVTALILLSPKQGWHNYWSNPGDAGAPTRLAWTLPAGTPVPSEPRYPVPETLLVSGLMNHVYAHPNAMVVEIVPPAGLAPGTPFPVTVKADWLVCSDEQCVPEGATLSLSASIGTGAADSASAAAVARARAALPKAVDWPIRYTLENGRFVLAVPFAAPGSVKAVHFFPDADGVIDYAAPQSITLSGDMLRIETGAAATPDIPADGTLTGVVRIDRIDEPEPLGFSITARPGPVPAAGVPLSTRTESSTTNLLPILALAVLGGLLLNVMPCVFPILSLKALSLAKGNVDAGKARGDALAYTAGTVLICAALGGLVLALRAAGSQIGWAFQLQDPRVIALLLLLVTAIALNLAGLFEINFGSGSLGQSVTARDDSLGSFATGALAAFIATPCTGPFMAGALGAALVLPPAAGLLVFAGLGFGLALPFLAIGFVPALRRRLPRPGPWMARLRALLSVPMFLTALALAWVLGRQSGADGMAIGLTGAVLLGLLLWWLGRRQHQGRPNWLPGAASLAVIVAAAVLIPTATPTAAAATASQLDAEPYTPARLAELRAARQPVFLYMTADWCITCKVNEKGAMASPRVAEAFKAGGITVLRGDWTRPDPAIAAWLAEHGRAGIPVYTYYAPDGREQELPQLLSVEALTGLVA
ncbi:protein-disulfide reductase DsbD family protein [Polymorphobacter sp.]|uniref:protein-disulfide reductase DsbD family protein n=1 Tax=Polymorphobacter sp. TaxID=1909290 RepID=UPI003F6EE57F